MAPADAIGMTKGTPFHVVCATDLGSVADEALRQADAVVRRRRGELTLLHVLRAAPRTHPLFSQLFEHVHRDLPELARRAAIALSARATAVTGRHDGEFGVEVEAGEPYAVIVERAEAVGADLLVLAGGGTAGARWGGVAEKAVRHAHCPVLLARPAPPSGKLLVATDLSDPALPAVAAAAAWARECGQRLTIVYSIEWGPALVAPELGRWAIPSFPSFSFTEADKAAAKDAMREQLLAALARFDADGEPVVEEGPAPEAILRVARELPAELLVLGTAGRTGLSRMLLGSVAEAVARSAPCPVLVVRLAAAR